MLTNSFSVRRTLRNVKLEAVFPSAQQMRLNVAPRVLIQTQTPTTADNAVTL